MAGNHTVRNDPWHARSPGTIGVNDDPYVDTYGDFQYSTRWRTDAVAAVQPLIDHLHKYERVRGQLLRQGGRLRDLAGLAAVLKQPISLGSHYGDENVCLANRAELNRAVWDVAWGEIHLDVRQLEDGWPVYYLCRTRAGNSWTGGLIVEDLYRTPDYEFVDDRFAKLMVHGREEDFLRLSPHRRAVETSGLLGKKPTREDVDKGLLLVGRHVLQSAWHEDQRLGMLVAETLDIPVLAQAIELLYLCLSGELCELRGMVDDFLLGFFRQIIPHPPIDQLLVGLGKMSGDGLNRLPRLALKRYTDLSRAFNSFLATPVAWRGEEARTPFYKLLFANVDRFGAIAARIRGQQPLVEASGKLARVAGQVIESLLHATEPETAGS